MNCMLVNAHACSRMLTYAHVCWRMLAYADTCLRMLTYSDVCSQQAMSRVTSPPPHPPSTVSATLLQSTFSATLPQSTVSATLLPQSAVSATLPHQVALRMEEEAQQAPLRASLSYTSLLLSQEISL
jgi:hypothetical protein